MRKIRFFTLCIFLLVSARAFSQNNILPGHWEGALTRLGSVQLLNFDFIPVNDSIEVQYNDPAKGFYNSFTEGEKKIGIADTAFDLNFGYGNFHCILKKEYQQITGSNKNWNPEVLFHIKKTGSKEPTTYTEENIAVKNGNIVLAGTIYKPTLAKRYPLVILIHGSDEQTRRTTYIRSLIYILTKNGIGVLACDKRGTGASGGDMHTASFADLENDAAATLHFIEKRKDLSITRFGFFATSAGGWIAPAVANKNSAINFIILNAGPAVSTFKQDEDRVEYSLRQDGYDEKVIDSALQHSKLYFDVVKNNTGWEELHRSVELYKTRTWATETAQLQLPEKMNDEDMRWWRSHDYDPANDLSHLKCRVLSLMGESDNLVPPATNKPLMEKYLTAAGCVHKIVLFPNAGHNCIGFQTLPGGEWNWPEHYWIWPKRSEAYYDEIVKWIKNIAE